MSTKISLTYFGMEGEGRTLTEAKKDAGAKIEAALQGSYTPEIFAYRGWAAIAFREPQGWCERIIVSACGDDAGIRTGPVWGCPSHATKAEALRAIRNHLAQLGWTYEDSDEAPDFITDRGDRAEFSRWVTFQRRYRAATKAGLLDGDVHAYACGSLGRPDLEERVNQATAAVGV